MLYFGSLNRKQFYGKGAKRKERSQKESWQNTKGKEGSEKIKKSCQKIVAVSSYNLIECWH